jgi:hypothetical protein
MHSLQVVGQNYYNRTALQYFVPSPLSTGEGPGERGWHTVSLILSDYLVVEIPPKTPILTKTPEDDD